MNRLLSALAVCCTLYSASVGGLARAGTIAGSVPLKASDLAIYSPGHSDSYVGRIGASTRNRSAVPSDSTFGVAYVLDVAAVPDSLPARALLDQSCHRFVPRILAIVAGQTVEFRNNDNVYHNIFSYSPPKRFDLGRYPRGQSKLQTFPKSGAIQVYCDIHSDMRADIIVVPGPHFAYVNDQGRFRIEGVPPGAHTVAIWLPSSGERRGTVTVPESGEAEVVFPAL